MPDITSHSLQAPTEEETKVALDKPTTVKVKESVVAAQIYEDNPQDTSAATENNQE